MSNEKQYPQPERRQPQPGQPQQGSNDLPSRQQQGGMPPINDDKLPQPRKPDVEEPDDALEEDHYDRIV